MGFSPCFSNPLGTFIAHPGKEPSHLGFPCPKWDEGGMAPQAPLPGEAAGRAQALAWSQGEHSRAARGVSVWGFLPGRPPFPPHSWGSILLISAPTAKAAPSLSIQGTSPASLSPCSDYCHSLLTGVSAPNMQITSGHSSSKSHSGSWLPYCTAWI